MIIYLDRIKIARSFATAGFKVQHNITFEGIAA